MLRVVRVEVAVLLLLPVEGPLLLLLLVVVEVLLVVVGSVLGEVGPVVVLGEDVMLLPVEAELPLELHEV